MRFKGMLILFTLLALLFNASAIAGCAFAPTADYPANNIKKMVVPLATNVLSVPPGVTTGTIVYRQRINITSGADKIRVGCDNTGAFQFIRGYKSLPLAETSSGSKIYKTGIDGLGIRFVNSATIAFPVTSQASGCQSAASCFYTDTGGIWTADSYFELVKTGNNMTGGNLTATNLPTALYSFGQANGMVGIYEISISGNLSVNVPTCDVSPASQSMVVQMGSHKVSEFSGQYTGTAWKDATIRLSNCGVFYGASSSSLATFNGTSNISVVALSRNRAKVTFSFHETPTDPTEGIMAIDNSPYSAVGIGIQLSWKQDISGKINLNNPFRYSINSIEPQIITLPLYARYVQTTTSAPLPGHANGKLEFVVSYE